MRGHFFGRRARRAVALLAAAALLNVAGAARGPHARAPAASGQVVTAAGLTVDGSPAVAGQTLFTGSAFDTAEGAAASLALGNLARVRLSAETSLRLDFDASSLGGVLDAGAALVYAPRGVAAAFKTPDAYVLSDAASGEALFSLEASEAGTKLSVRAGRVEMRAGGRSATAVAGRTLYAAGGSGPEGAPPQGDSLSGGKKTGIFVGIAATLAAVILVVTGRREKEEEPDFGGCPITLSPTDGPPPPCF